MKSHLLHIHTQVTQPGTMGQEEGDFCKATSYVDFGSYLVTKNSVQHSVSFLVFEIISYT